MRIRLAAAVTLLAATAAPVAAAPSPPSVAAFNRTIAQAAVSGRAWVRSPLQVTIRFLGDPAGAAGRALSIAIAYSTGETPHGFGTLARSTVIIDGLSDDSVRSMRHRLVLVYRRPGMWTLRSAAQAWRCRPGRGHQGYSTEPCV